MSNRIFFAVCLVISLGHMIWAAGQVPDTLATHFGAGGQPDDWASRTGFLITYFVLTVVMVVIFAGLPLLMRRLPPSSFSLPNRDYWMTPLRREGTLKRLTSQLLTLGGATLLFDSAIMHLVVMANRLEEPRLHAVWFWGVFIAYLAGVGIWTAWIIRAYRVPKA